MRRGVAPGPKCVEFTGEIKQIKRDPVRLVGQRRGLDGARVERELTDQREFVGRQAVQLGTGQELAPRPRFSRQLRHGANRVAQHGMAAGMRILHVEHWVIPRLLNHFGKVEIEHRVVLAEQHHEADGVGADLVDHLAKRDEFPCPLRHLHRLAAAQQLHKLDDLDIEERLLLGDRSDRRLDALDVATVVGTPDVDKIAEPALELVAVISNVRGEIGVRAVRLE
jgi:hypothetical protein